MNTLKISCVGAALMELDDLVEFQGDLKSLSKTAYKQLRNELEETGFGFPFRVWRNSGKANLIGGHQTKRVLQKMREEGWSIPRLPVSFIEARDLKEAKRRVLQDIAQYGKIERQGLYEFLYESEIDFSMVETSFYLPEVDMESFKFEYLEKEKQEHEFTGTLVTQDSEGKETVREVDLSPVAHDKEVFLTNHIKRIVLLYENDRFEQIIAKANTYMAENNISDYSSCFEFLLSESEKRSN